MKITAQIKEPIREEMELFEQKFRSSMSSKVALLNRITYYIVNRKGKQMRPMFVFLVAKMVSGGKVSERTYRGASVIELIHTATLVHDDVVDDSNKRRGFFSINALWKNKIAVLVGDYLLSKGLLLSIDNGDFDYCRRGVLRDYPSENRDTYSRLLCDGSLFGTARTNRSDRENATLW